MTKRHYDSSEMEPQQIHQLLSVGRKQGMDSDEFHKRLARIISRYEDERIQAYAERLAKNALQCDLVLENGPDPEAEQCAKFSRQKLAQICLGKLTIEEITGQNTAVDPIFPNSEPGEPRRIA